MSEIKAVTYEESRKEFFVDKYREAIKKMDYWQKRAKNKSVLSKENYLANKYGEEACYYEDIVRLLEVVEKLEKEEKKVSE